MDLLLFIRGAVARAFETLENLFQGLHEISEIVLNTS